MSWAIIPQNQTSIMPSPPALETVEVPIATFMMLTDRLSSMEEAQASLLKHTKWTHMVNAVKQGRSRKLDLGLWGLPRIPTIVSAEFNDHEMASQFATIVDGDPEWNAACIEIVEGCRSSCAVSDWEVYKRLYRAVFPDIADALIAYEDTDEETAGCKEFGIQSGFSLALEEARFRHIHSHLDRTRFSDATIIDGREMEGCQHAIALKAASPTLLSDFIMEGIRLFRLLGHGLSCIKRITIVPCDWQAIQLEVAAQAWCTGDDAEKARIRKIWINKKRIQTYASMHTFLYHSASDGYIHEMLCNII